jgi:DNA processing protein
VHISTPEPDYSPGDKSASSKPAVDLDRVARALLSYLAGSAGDALIAVQALMPPIDILAYIQSGTLPADASGHLHELRLQGLTAALSQWRGQLADLPADGGIADAHRAGIRLICPGDSEWPPALEDLGASSPWAIWARGTGDLRACSHRAVAIVGTRAATAYGVHVATEITADLAACGLTIISGAAYGIDAAAHKAALASGGLTVAVLACGPDISCPREHAELLEQITAHGLIISEYPPGRHPTRAAFLARNRIIAALAGAGTVVVEAPRASGALNAARHASRLSRPLMAVPGPVTSAASAGCNELITSSAATCVTCAADIHRRCAQLP